MVRRLLIVLAAMASGLALVAPVARAVNTRVEIAYYHWSNPAVQINLGEKVTWDWLGPDLAHSVTGISANDLGWDSDPGTDAPDHRAGDTFTLQFNSPGTYLFQCKLHAFVRGEVIVSDLPGEPNSDPGPQPPLNIDLTPPTLGAVSLERSRFRGARGTTLSAAIDSKGTFEAQYYRFNSRGKRIYNGYQVWKAFIGLNRFALGARWKHFRARPGNYEAVLRATDTAANVSKPVRKRFTILG